MRRISTLLAVCGFAACFLLAERPAKANLLYIYGSDALPFHYAWRSDTGNVTNSQTSQGTPFGLDSLAFGLGIGYTGLNGQLDIRNAYDQWTGSATVGLREALSLGPIELWARAGIGLGLVFDSFGTSGVKTTGAITTDFEAGVDWFFISNLGVGLKGIITPQYSFPRTLSTDIGLALEIRVRI